MSRNTAEDSHAPYILYKSDISYFSGKLEAYLHYKGIVHSKVDIDRASMDVVQSNTGFKKVPALKTADDLWLFDTTPTIAWFEQRYPAGAVLPGDPALSFIAELLEDYGDEWLWRPAMWWRWVPRDSRWALGWRIGNAMLGAKGARLLGWYFGRRQLQEWLWDDGVDDANADDVRDMLYREFEFLEPLLEQQPFLLGSHPSVADYGYFGSMFRHFGNDPESAEVMRRRAPNTYEWTARLWNLTPGKLAESQQWQWPIGDFWLPLLQRLTGDYLPYLHQNALAYREGKSRFDYRGHSLAFKHTKTTRYRVWCRENLQRRYTTLSEPDKRRVDELFEPCGGLSVLLQDGVIDSGMAADFQLPRDPKTAGQVKSSLAVSLFGQARN